MNIKKTIFILASFFISQSIQGLVLESPVFKQNNLIPAKYTCDGADVSPALNWSDIPEVTKSFVLIVDDPDAKAGTWTHWILLNIPAKTKQLAENIRNLPTNTLEGKNSWQQKTYQGPCPPDLEHRYVFKLFALDNNLNLSEGATSDEVQAAMRGHVVGKTELVGRYDRKKE